MVAVVCSPSKGKFRHVSGTHHQSACLIGIIHQNLGTFARLAVFVGHVVLIDGVPDIPEMLSDSFHNGNLLHGHACRLHQFHGVVIGPFGGTKPWHGDPVNIFTRQSEDVECFDRYQESERRVQSPRNTHDRCCYPGMPEPLCQAVCLDLEYFRKMVSGHLFGWNKRVGVKCPVPFVGSAGR